MIDWKKDYLLMIKILVDVFLSICYVCSISMGKIME